MLHYLTSDLTCKTLQNPFTSHRVLAHPQGFVGQVAWSANGNTLLTKLGRGVKLWTEVSLSLDAK